MGLFYQISTKEYFSYQNTKAMLSIMKRFPKYSSINKKKIPKHEFKYIELPLNYRKMALLDQISANDYISNKNTKAMVSITKRFAK